MNDKKILNDFVVIKAIEDSVNVIDRTIHGAYLGN